MVPTIFEGKTKTPMLSAMQLEKGLKKNEMTYLTALKEDPTNPMGDLMGDPMAMEVKKVLDVAQLSYNLRRSKATDKTLFEIVMGQQSMTPHTLAKGYTRKSLMAYKLDKGWHE